MFDAIPLVLAQNGPTRETAPPPYVPLDGEAITRDPDATAPAPRGGFGDGGLIWILLLGFMFIFLFSSVFGQRKEKKRRAQMLAALAKGKKVQTIGGIIGTVVEVRDSEVVVKVDENTNARIKFARSAIQTVIEEKENGGGTSA